MAPLLNSKPSRRVSVFFGRKSRLRGTDRAPHPSQNNLVLAIGERHIASKLHQGTVFEGG
jgi:hypothetical protein